MARLFLLASLICVSLANAVRGSEPTVASTLSNTVAADGLFIHWREHIIDDEAGSGLPLRGADGFELADFDQDGYMDVAVMWEDSSHLRVSFGTEEVGRWQTHSQDVVGYGHGFRRFEWRRSTGHCHQRNRLFPQLAGATR